VTPHGHQYRLVVPTSLGGAVNQYRKRVMIAKKLHNRICGIICSFLIITSIYILWALPTGTLKGYTQGLRVNQKQLHCSDLPGSDDIVLLLKTGVNEVEQRLPVLKRTLFNCARHVLVYSDVKQNFQGTYIHNALTHLPRYLDVEDPDLIHYNNLQDAYVNGTAASINREAGWKLDRYKYMPMMQSAYKLYPNAKWYVFVETDTALLWSNLVTWLSQMDPTVPKYIGSQVVGSKAPDGKDYIFAHGGSGFIVSNAAAKMFVTALQTKEWNLKFFNFAKNDCCGDAALAKALWELGIRITPAFPNSSGETPESVADYNKDWCFAPVFFHHMNQNQIEQVYLFDERKSHVTVSGILCNWQYDTHQELDTNLW
jgi:Fringe-like